MLVFTLVVWVAAFFFMFVGGGGEREGDDIACYE